MKLRQRSSNVEGINSHELGTSTTLPIERGDIDEITIIPEGRSVAGITRKSFTTFKSKIKK